VVMFSRQLFGGVACTPTEGALHLKSKNANILKLAFQRCRIVKVFFVIQRWHSM